MGGNTGSGGGNNEKAKKDTQVFGYEKEIQKQKAKEKALADAAKGTLSDPREKDDTAARADLKKGNQVKSTGGDGGGQQKQQETKKIIVEDKAKSEAETQAAAEQADAYRKRRLALTGGRSLFARRGGRGFFN